jgi:hypothetical protein
MGQIKIYKIALLKTNKYYWISLLQVNWLRFTSIYLVTSQLVSLCFDISV